MHFPVTNVSRSQTGTQLVTKRVMSLHPHNPQFWSKVNPPNIAIPAPRCGGFDPALCRGNDYNESEEVWAVFRHGAFCEDALQEAKKAAEKDFYTQPTYIN